MSKKGLDQDIVNKLDSLYLDISKPAAFLGKNKLYTECKKRGWYITLAQISKYLRSKRVYTVYKLRRKRWKRQPIIVWGLSKNSFRKQNSIARSLDWLWSADLADMQSLKNSNKGVSFLLVCINCFSYKLRVEPLKSKHGPVVRTAFQNIFKEETPPSNICTDLGAEVIVLDI